MGSGDLKEQHPAVAADFTSDDDEFLSVELHDARNGAPEYLALRFLVGESIQALTPVAPLAFGVAGARYR